MIYILKFLVTLSKLCVNLEINEKTLLKPL